MWSCVAGALGRSRHSTWRPDHSPISLPLDRRYARPVPTANEWLDVLASAWRAERLAARARIAIERSGRPLVERVALGIALAHLRIVDETSAPGARVRVRVAVPDTTDLD